MTTLRTRVVRAPEARPRNSGQALAFFGVFLVVLVATVGIGVDGGILYLSRRKMQIAADAASLAGARIMGGGDNSSADIRAQIDQYASLNQVDNPAQNVTAYYTDPTQARIAPLTSASGAAPATATGIEVVTIRRAPTLFLPVLGINNLEVSALAAAQAKPAAGPGGYAIFAIAANQPPGSKVIDWSGGNWTINGAVHSNSDVNMSGPGNTINGSVQDVTGANPTGLTGATLNPATNNPVQSTVLPDPVNKTLADFYQGTASTPTYHYIAGSTNLSSYITNGVLQPGVYYVNGDINFATSLSSTVPSTVTLVATGGIQITSPNMNFAPYSQQMTFFANVTSSNTGLNISGSNGSWSGIAYAPHSNLRASGSSNMSYPSSLVGNTVTLTGSGGTLTYTAYFPTSPAEIVLYK